MFLFMAQLGFILGLFNFKAPHSPQQNKKPQKELAVERRTQGGRYLYQKTVKGSHRDGGQNQLRASWKVRKEEWACTANVTGKREQIGLSQKGADRFITSAFPWGFM